MSGWSFLAGFANTLGGTLQQRQQAEQAEKLRKMQEDAAMKRDMFLAEYKAKVDAEKTAAEREATKNDVVSQFTDPETGSVYGRTKGGGTVPLHETSEEYRQSLRDKAASDIEYKKAQRESAQARAERARRPAVAKPEKVKEPKPDPIHKEIRAAYMKERERLRAARTDEMELDTSARASLYPAFGGANVSKALGQLAGSASPAQQQPASAKADQPGSSKENPIPAQSLSSEPPPGTWVQLPNGRVIQIGS